MMVESWLMAVGFLFCAAVSGYVAALRRQPILLTVSIPAFYTACIYWFSTIFAVGANFLTSFARPGTLLTVVMTAISLIYMAIYIVRRSK